MMKRTLLFAMTFAVAAMQTEARQVTQAEALDKARQWQATHSAAAKGMTQTEPQLALEGEGEATPYYIYSYGEGRGYVIVSGDDRTVPVLGYADSGTFEAAAMPEAMRQWLAGYAEQIAQLGDGERPSLGVTLTYAPIEPMLSTTWNQNEPYNGLCPVEAASEDGERCVTGCVATAMAQGLAYEATAHGGITGWTEIPGYTFDYRFNGSVYTQKVDTMAAHAIDWSLLRADYLGNETLDDAGAAEVAALMAACGTSVGMQYHDNRLGGSSASLASVPEALRKYFGFTGNTYYAEAADYTVLGWVDLIYHELKEGRVVLYSGQSGTGGHSFVCDGYREGYYFHFNWGWGGMSDGYYVLTVCNPDNQGIGGSAGGYSSKQGAVIGLSAACSDTYQGERTKGTGYLALMSLQKEGEHTLYNEMKFTPTVYDQSDYDYKGTIMMRAGGVSIGFAGLALRPGDFSQPTFYYIPRTTGSIPIELLEVEIVGDGYRAIRTLAQDTLLIGETSIRFQNDFGSALTVTSANTGNWGSIEGEMYTGYYTLTNGNAAESLSGMAVVHLFEMYEDGSGSFSGNSVSSYTVHVTVPAGGSIDVPFELGPMKPGVWYMTSLYFTYGGTQYRYQGNMYLSGIAAVERDAAREDTPAYNLYGRRVGEGYRGIVIQNGRKRLQKQ